MGEGSVLVSEVTRQGILLSSSQAVATASSLSSESILSKPFVSHEGQMSPLKASAPLMLSCKGRTHTSPRPLVPLHSETLDLPQQTSRGIWPLSEFVQKLSATQQHFQFPGRCPFLRRTSLMVGWHRRADRMSGHTAGAPGSRLSHQAWRGLCSAGKNAPGLGPLNHGVSAARDAGCSRVRGEPEGGSQAKDKPCGLVSCLGCCGKGIGLRQDMVEERGTVLV